MRLKTICHKVTTDTKGREKKDAHKYISATPVAYDESRNFTPRLSVHGPGRAGLAWRAAKRKGSRRSNKFQESELRSSICFVYGWPSIAIPDHPQGAPGRRFVPARISGG